MISKAKPRPSFGLWPGLSASGMRCMSDGSDAHTGPAQARDQSRSFDFTGRRCNDRRGKCGFPGEGREARAGGHDDIHIHLDEVGSHGRKAIRISHGVLRRLPANAANRRRHSGVSAANPHNRPTERIRSCGCAPAIIGHAATPPSNVMNSRRRMPDTGRSASHCIFGSFVHF